MPEKFQDFLAFEVLIRDSVTVKVLTGDNEIVTRKICRDVKLDAGETVLGSQVAGTTHRSFKQVGSWSRFSPKR
jgi:Mg2+-importing ATPase